MKRVKQITERSKAKQGQKVKQIVANGGPHNPKVDGSSPSAATNF
jgi:hypothetical protein